MENSVSNLKSIVFKSLQLPKKVAEHVKENLHNIAHWNHCYIKTELKHKKQLIPIPKASLTTISHTSKSIKEQAIQFCSSSNVFMKITVGNGSIEIRSGDIGQQQASLKAVICHNLHIFLGRCDYYFKFT